MAGQRIRFTASKAPAAVAAFRALTAAYGQADSRVAEVIVALGGDGFMLQTLHAAHGRRQAYPPKMSSFQVWAKVRTKWSPR